MYNFFVEKDNLLGDECKIFGADYNHIKNVLRFREGDEFLISVDGQSHLSKIIKFDDECVLVKIIEKNYNSTNLPVKIYLFQGLPKSDKLELIVQKAVELGVHEIIPVETSRSIVKYDDKKKKAKTQRYQAIAESAAKQSKRNYVPSVKEAISFNQMLDMAKSLDLFLVPYESELGMDSTKSALSLLKKDCSVGVFIGPEGGISPTEIEKAKEIGGKIISLGSRILRTETAALTALSLLMLHAEMNV